MRNIFTLILCLPFYCNSATLFYLDQSELDKCVAKTRVVGTKSEHTLLTAKTCPTAWVWDGELIFYVEGGHLWRHDGKAKTEKLGSVPRPDVELWVNYKSGNPMIAYMAPVDENSVTSQESTDGLVFTYTFEGKTYKATGLPPWGTPWMAIIAEFKNGKWNRVEVAPTRGEAGDTPGLLVLKGYSERNRRSKSLREILMSATCYGGLNCDASQPTIVNLLGKQEGYGAIKIKNGGTFAFATVSGDTLHATAPVYFCKTDCKKGIRLKDVMDQQIALSVSDTTVLIAREYDNTFPRVYDGRNGKLLFSLPKARNAIWLE